MGLTLDRLGEALARVLAKRKQRLPEVRERIEAWETWLASTDRFLDRVDSLLDRPDADSLRDLAASYPRHIIRSRIQEGLEELRRVEKRLARETINIGVSGQARVGKSTLLQMLSGLSEHQIPTGDNVEVTAVRSRIYHDESVGAGHAVLSKRTFDDFRSEVLEPLLEQIRKAGGNVKTPATLQEFTALQLPVDLPAAFQSYLNKLAEYQVRLPQVGDDLNGAVVQMPLANLRPWVAFPTTEDKLNSGYRHLYLAVKEAEIRCPFPRAGVQSLALIDLPGLGGLGNEEHHLKGVASHVDVVLMLKRGEQGQGFWKDEDIRCLRLLKDARDQQVRERDFILILLNEGGLPESKTLALRGSVLENLNGGIDGKNYRVLHWQDKERAPEEVLFEVLKHLEEFLPKMDEAVFEGARTTAASIGHEVSAIIGKIHAAVEGALPVVQANEVKIREKAEEVRTNLGGRLFELEKTLFARARAVHDDGEFVTHLEMVKKKANSWICGEQFLGQPSREAWNKEALARFKLDRSSFPHRTNELNRLRVAIANIYSGTDSYLRMKMESFFDALAICLASELGALAPHLKGKRFLEALQEKFSAVSGANILADALQAVLSIEMSYRPQFYPRVSAALDILRPEPDERSAQQNSVHNLSIDEEGVNQLAIELEGLAEAAAYEMYKSLIAEQRFPALVQAATAEQFADAFILTDPRKMDAQFWAVFLVYGYDMWPEMFSVNQKNQELVREVKQAAQGARESAESAVRF